MWSLEGEWHDSRKSGYRARPVKCWVLFECPESSSKCIVLYSLL